MLYLCNGKERVHMREAKGWDLHTILLDQSIDRGDALVEIGAYALMPNHIHIVLKQVCGGGVALFMQKLFTSYTMYFNKKYNRTGSLFAGTFKSKHITDDLYLKRAAPYVLLNPIELYEPRWKEGVGDIKRIEKSVLEYPYTNLADFMGKERPEKAIVGTSLSDMYDKKPTLRELVSEAQEYYREIRPLV
jgi:REP element-mobilizing transposase RayT